MTPGIGHPTDDDLEIRKLSVLALAIATSVELSLPVWFHGSRCQSSTISAGGNPRLASLRNSTSTSPRLLPPTRGVVLGVWSFAQNPILLFVPELLAHQASRLNCPWPPRITKVVGLMPLSGRRTCSAVLSGRYYKSWSMERLAATLARS